MCGFGLHNTITIYRTDVCDFVEFNYLEEMKFMNRSIQNIFDIRNVPSGWLISAEFIAIRRTYIYTHNGIADFRENN